MQTPAPSLSLRLTPPALKSVVVARDLFFIVALLAFMVWSIWSANIRLIGSAVFLLGFLVLMLVERIRVVRGAVYEVDDSGISFVAPKSDTRTIIAWSEIDEVHCRKEGVISLYSRARDTVVRLSPLHQNYVETMPVLLENLYPLWREMAKKSDYKVSTRYVQALVPFLCIGVGVAMLMTNPWGALLLIGLGIYSIYEGLRHGNRIRLLAYEIEIAKGWGYESLALDAITAIEFDPKRHGGNFHHNLLIKHEGEQIQIGHIDMNPTLLYFVLHVRRREHLRKATVS